MKTVVSMLGLIGFFVLAAGTSAVVMAAGAIDIRSCRTIADPARRLICYDSIPTSDAGVALEAKPPASLPAPMSVAKPISEESKLEKFGAETLPQISGSNAPPSALAARVIGHVEDLQKGQLVKLDNGQIWKCIDDRHYSDYEADAPAVTIERNLMGTYWMHLAGAAFSIKVSRIQ